MYCAYHSAQNYICDDANKLTHSLYQNNPLQNKRVGRVMRLFILYTHNTRVGILWIDRCNNYASFACELYFKYICLCINNI